MNLASLSIKRPVFITAIVSLMMVLGLYSYKKMPVDQFPDVTFPIVFVEVMYPGASPVDVERQISKPIEDETSSLPGLDTVTSYNYDSVAMVVIQFKLGTDIKEGEQQVRNRIQNIRNKFPKDAKEPVVRRFDPADQPIVTLALNSQMNAADLYDVANEKIKPLLERTQDVGLVRIVGGRKKEILVEVDKNKLQDRRISMLQVAQKIESTSKDIPLGKFEDDKQEIIYRTKGEFSAIEQIKDVVVNFLGSDRPVKLGEIATIKESLADAKRFSSINGDNALFLEVYKQSGSNTVAVSDRIKNQVVDLNQLLKERNIEATVKLVRDSSVPIRLNVKDVQESIFIGILLCIIVVFLFLGSFRSTFITGLALPNSLLGGFIIMYFMGFSINIMTLIALSLAVGLLIDDAIVVRENIFRHLEMGKDPKTAALDGANEVAMAVVATTLVVIAVFGPIAFVPGIVGQFFKQFGLTVVFTMIISLFDAFTVAPMLSAYMAPKNVHEPKKDNFINRFLKKFDAAQTWLENKYESTLVWTLKRKGLVVASATVFFVVSVYSGKFIKKTFLPPADISEFMVTVEMPSSTSITGTNVFSKKIEAELKQIPEIELVAMTVGSNSYESNKSSFYVHLVEPSQRKGKTTSFMKDIVREKLKSYNSEAIIAVTDVDISGAGQKPLNLYIVGEDLNELSTYVLGLQKEIQKIPDLIDVDTNFRQGKLEYQVAFDRIKSEELGVSTVTAGAELRNRIEGATPAVYRQNGIEYDVRVRLPESEKNLKKAFNTTLVPNQNYNMIPLSKVAKAEEATGFSQINRQNKGRFIAITANISSNGSLGTATDAIEKMMKTTHKPPLGVTYQFIGQAKDFQDLMVNMSIALGFGILFIYLVLASLYESFVTPFTILLALPLAISGAFAGLLIFDKTIDIFSIIGLILLMGVVAKNSILLVDYTLQLIRDGLPTDQALIKSGKTRLRPIIMTSLALIAGMIPIAVGVTALGSQRQSMGIAIIGGVISSTVLTLVVVPAAYEYIEKFRLWTRSKFI